MVKVVATSGEEWTKTTRARTPQADLARGAPGNFRRHLGHYGWGRLSAADLADPPRGYDVSYAGGLDFIGAALFSAGDRGEFAWEISSDDRHVYLGTPIFLNMSGGPGNWWGYEKVDKVLCASDGPPATYAWSVSPGRVFTDDYNTRYLHLRAVDEPCGGPPTTPRGRLGRDS
jgi:hypothetical protein